jgi:hypothetical protein
LCSVTMQLLGANGFFRLHYFIFNSNGYLWPLPNNAK